MSNSNDNKKEYCLRDSEGGNVSEDDVTSITENTDSSSNFEQDQQQQQLEQTQAVSGSEDYIKKNSDVDQISIEDDPTKLEESLSKSTIDDLPSTAVQSIHIENDVPVEVEDWVFVWREKVTKSGTMMSTKSKFRKDEISEEMAHDSNTKVVKIKIKNKRTNSLAHIKMPPPVRLKQYPIQHRQCPKHHYQHSKQYDHHRHQQEQNRHKLKTGGGKHRKYKHRTNDGKNVKCLKAFTTATTSTTTMKSVGIKKSIGTRRPNLSGEIHVSNNNIKARKVNSKACLKQASQYKLSSLSKVKVARCRSKDSHQKKKSI